MSEEEICECGHTKFSHAWKSKYCLHYKWDKKQKTFIRDCKCKQFKPKCVKTRGNENGK